MGYPYPQDTTYPYPLRNPPFPSAHQADNKYQARRSNIPDQQKKCSNVTQHHALQEQQCLVSGSLDNKPITILIYKGSSISPLDEQLYYSLSSVPPLQPLPFSVSGADDKPLITLGKTFISIAIDDDTFRVQLVVTRNILFPVVLGIDFLQTDGGIISFPINQLYLTNPSPKPADPPINADHILNTYTPPIHTPNTNHPSSRLTVHPNQPYHKINTEPVTIPARANAVMTVPCTLPCSGNSLFEPLKQYFVNQPVQYTPVIITAENGNLPVHFINHSDHEVVIPKHSYFGAKGEKVQESSDQDILLTNTSPEPVSQHALSKCLAHSDLLPKITPPLKITLQKTHLTLPPHLKTYLQNLLSLKTQSLLTVYCQITLGIPQQIM